MFNRLLEKLHLAYHVNFWFVDDNTTMPIACGSEETARLVAKEEFNDEQWRVVGPIGKWYRVWDK